MEKIVRRCWKTKNQLYLKYHDEEWGVPVHSDNKMFEFLALGGFQAGLTWEIILNKREAFRKAFDNFDPEKIASYNEEKILELMNNPNIIRNKAKILATIHNASRILEIQNEFGSLDAFLWRFSNGKPSKHTCDDYYLLPTESEESRAMSKEMKKRGFKFVGPKICCAFMQAVGIVNDHLEKCFRYEQIELMK